MKPPSDENRLQTDPEFNRLLVEWTDLTKRLHAAFVAATGRLSLPEFVSAALIGFEVVIGDRQAAERAAKAKSAAERSWRKPGAR